MRSAFIKALINAARTSPNLWLLTADLGYSFLEPFAKEFPLRFVNVGVAEQNMMSIAAGLALCGKKVVVYSIINFATFRALEQIRNDICYHHLDVTIVGVGAGYFYGSQGYSHHCIEDVGIMRCLPHMKIYCPMDAEHTEELSAQILSHTGPAYLRLGRSPVVSQDYQRSQDLGSALLLRKGKEVMILALGEAVAHGIAVAALLDAQNISAGVMTFPRVVPIDEEAIIAAVKEDPLIVIIEEHGVGGLATLVAEVLMKRTIRAHVKVVQLPSIPIHIGGSSQELLQEVGLSAQAIAEALLQELSV